MTALVLARQPAFDLGPLRVCPETRSVTRDGREEVLEPRVMQVLVALAEAGGHVVARDDLVERCWNGRIVGDDAINRVISRLRRLAEGAGRDIFAIETVTKVGYRLRRLDGETQSSAEKAAPAAISPSTVVTRRTALVAAAGAAALAAGGGWLWIGKSESDPLATTEEALFTQARLAASQQTREGQSQAIAILRQLTERRPDHAGTWAMLGTMYAQISHYRPQAEAALLQQRAREAALRALALEPDNADAIVALADARPDMGNWLDTERRLRDRLARGGDTEGILRSLTQNLALVGRNGEALALFRQLMSRTTPSPSREYGFARMLWAAGRLHEADGALARAGELYPTHFAIWFARFYALLHSGRQSAALALAADVAQRPSNIGQGEIESVMRVARASLEPVPARIDGVIAEWLARSREGAGHAENAVQFAVLLGRRDVAAAILRAYYFGEGFVVPESRYGLVNDTSTPFNDRQTTFLFMPSMNALHGTAPFRAITRRLGLDDYWLRSRSSLSSRGVPLL